MRNVFVLFSLALGLAFPTVAGSQQVNLCGEWDAELIPQPAIEGAALSVHVFSRWGVPPGPVLSSFSISGAEVVVQMEGPTSGPAAVVNFSRTIDIGNLVEGAYSILLDVTLSPGMPDEQSLTCDPIPVEVLRASPIPSVSQVGLAFLGTMLALFGVRRLAS